MQCTPSILIRFYKEIKKKSNKKNLIFVNATISLKHKKQHLLLIVVLTRKYCKTKSLKKLMSHQVISGGPHT